MGRLKVIGGPRDGDMYKAPDGYRELDYWDEILLPYNEDGETKYATYRRKKIRTRQKTIQILDELHYVEETN